MKVNILTLLGLLGLAQGMFAQAPGAFVATGNMNSARFGHTATVLADGRVLIAGGNGPRDSSGNYNAVASAELYDPASGTFTRTGNMTEARVFHGATMLPDGEVMIFGGFSSCCIRFLDTAEIYDPSNGTFRRTGKMVSGGFSAAATLLRNGEVLIVSGSASGGTQAELYDPGTGTFRYRGSGTPNTYSAKAVALADGEVGIFGDHGSQLYDPETRAFTLIDSDSAGFGFTATPLANGKVLVAGGSSINVSGSSVEFGLVVFDDAKLFDPQTGKFFPTARLQQARYQHTATLLGDGSVLIAGGYSPAGSPSAEVYNTSTGTFATVGQMITPRDSHTATLLHDGRVLMTGGAGLSRAELYVPAWWPSPAPSIGVETTSLSFVSVDGQPAPQTIGVQNTGAGDLHWNVVTAAPWLTATPASGTNLGSVRITASPAGLAAGTYETSITILAAARNAPVTIPVTLTIPGAFTATGNMNLARREHTATVLADGRVLIAGGNGPRDSKGGDRAVASAELYDPATGTFAPTGNMTTPRIGHGAILLPDGRVLIFGGSDVSNLTDSAELYDPLSGTFRATGKMVGYGFRWATLLQNGKALIVGVAGSGALAEIYDPATGSFTAAGSGLMDEAGAVALADGKVLMVGYDGYQIYDPATRVFTPSTDVGIPLSGGTGTATLLANGSVLFAGGYSGFEFLEFDVDNDAELFDPHAGKFANTDWLRQARYAHTATLIGDGSVLIAGGYDSLGLSISGGEVYDSSSGIFSSAGRMITARAEHAATLLLDGRVLITGGWGEDGPVSNSELYVPAWWPGPAPSIGVDKTSLSFAIEAGRSATQTIALRNAGRGDLHWNVTTSAPWLSATPASGTNSGSFQVTASAAGLLAGTYSGSVSILAAAANTPMVIPVTLLVAPDCIYSVSPAGQAFSAAGGAGTIGITARTGCSWGVSSGLSWVAFGSATSGSGNGTVSFQVMPDSSAARSGTLSVAGLSFALEQQGSSLSGLSFGGSLAHLASAGNWDTTITLVNNGADAANARLSFLDNNGNPLALPLAFPQLPPASGPLLASTLDRSLSSNAQIVVESAGPDNATTLVGAGQLLTNGNVSGFGIFSNPTSHWNAVVPLETRNADRYILAFDNTGTLTTGVAIANFASQAANVSVIIRDDTGTQIDNPTIPLSALGHTSFMLNDPTLGFPATNGKRGTIEFDTPPGGQLSVLGLRANGPALTTLPVLANVGTGGGSITHVAYNAGWTSVFYLVNTGSTSASFTLSFFDENGLALPVPLLLPQSGTTVTTAAFTQTLAAGAMLVVDTQAQDAQSLVIGSAQLATTGNISGFEIFRWIAFGQEASVPLESRTPNSFVLVFDDTNGLTTGVALASNSGQFANILATFRDDTGTQIGVPATISLPAHGHTSFLLPEFYGAAAGKRGMVEFTVPPGSGVTVIGLRAKSDGTLTTIPVLTK